MKYILLVVLFPVMLLGYISKIVYRHLVAGWVAADWFINSEYDN